MAESQDVTLLQRRARRRLVGAIALVVLVVVALPIVLDKEPGPIGQDLVIQIPSQDAGKFNTRVLPPSAPGATLPPGVGAEVAVPAKTLTPGTAAVPQAAPAAAPARTEPRAAPSDAKAPSAPEPGARKESPSPAKGQTPAGKDESDAVRALALLEGKEAWVVRLGAFSNQDNVRQLQAKLAAAGIKSYTEAVKGPKGDQTRVRAGPFDSKAAAEQARDKIEAMGFRSGTVAPR